VPTTDRPRGTLRISEVAELTGASLTTVKEWVSSGRLTHSQPSGRGGVVLIRPADLDAFLDSHAEGVEVGAGRTAAARAARRRRPGGGAT
jgi:excisionase family DNA binding protein